MDIEAAFELAKRSIVVQTGKSLIDSQKSVLQGIIEGKKLREITDLYRYNDSYVKQISASLCKYLSAAFGEPVNKDNIRSVLEQRLRLEQLNRKPRARRMTRKIFLEQRLHLEQRNPEFVDVPDREIATCVPDWDYAPHVEPFYGRQSELEQLKAWITDEDRSRRSCLVVLYGMGGIGKTYLAIKAGKQLEKEFDFLIFRSIKRTPSLSKLIASIEDIINPGYVSTAKLSPEESITKLINSLKERRCLIILDDLESIFDPNNNVAGRYLPEFEHYAELVQRITLENHESCVLIVSREKVADIAELEGNRVHTLQISGSGEIAQQILESQGLEYNNTWQTIASNYGKNPLALKIMITMIQDLYGGQVKDFLRRSQATSYFSFHDFLDEQFSRLSPKEKGLMFVLTILQQASIAKIFNDNWLDLPQSDLIEYMSSLRRRSLLERTNSEFSLQPMVWRHTVERLIYIVENELINFIENEEPSLDELETLSSYPWQQKGQDNQRFLSLLQRHFRAKPVGKKLGEVLKTLEGNYSETSGYAISNLKLLLELVKA